MNRNFIKSKCFLLATICLATRQTVSMEDPKNLQVETEKAISRTAAKQDRLYNLFAELHQKNSPFASRVLELILSGQKIKNMLNGFSSMEEYFADSRYTEIDTPRLTRKTKIVCKNSGPYKQACDENSYSSEDWRRMVTTRNGLELIGLYKTMEFNGYTDWLWLETPTRSLVLALKKLPETRSCYGQGWENIRRPVYITPDFSKRSCRLGANGLPVDWLNEQDQPGYFWADDHHQNSSSDSPQPETTYYTKRTWIVGKKFYQDYEAKLVDLETFESTEPFKLNATRPELFQLRDIAKKPIEITGTKRGCYVKYPFFEGHEYALNPLQKLCLCKLTRKKPGQEAEHLQKIVATMPTELQMFLSRESKRP